MKYRGFDGYMHHISTMDYVVYDDETKGKSEPHLRARKLLKSMYPCDMILEEVTLPGSRRNGDVLYADFLIPAKSIIVEVQGEQHYKYIPFFHKTKMGFIQSRKRDRDKRDWCDLNAITLIELPDKESDSDWRNRIEAG